MNPTVVDLLQSASWPAFLVDEQGLLRHANQAAVIWFGSKVKESPPLDKLWRDQSETPTQFLQSWENLAPPTVTLQFEGRDTTAQSFTTRISSAFYDKHKWYLFQLFRMEAPGGTTTFTRRTKGTAGDPAAAKGAEAANSERLKEAMAMAQNIAIDLNNALTSILGHVSLVASQMEPSHPHRESLAQVEQAAERAAEVTGRLVQFAQQKSEPAKRLKSARLNMLIRQAVHNLPTHKDRKIEYTFLLEEAPHHVELEDAKLLQAFVKVLENSLETVERYGAVQISSRNLLLEKPLTDERARLEPGDYVCVEISDDGPGMTREVKERIFEPFYTTKPGHRGVGLSWVYGIVTNMGGSVAVTTAPGQGCAVRIYLPATPTLPESEAQAPPKPRILMVDDQEPVLITGRTILTTAGYAVTTAGSGQEALQLAKSEPSGFDLVITDLVMPRMNGEELIEHLRELIPDTPVLRISGFLAADEKSDKSCLQKPFTSRHLLERVKQALDVEDEI